MSLIIFDEISSHLSPNALNMADFIPEEKIYISNDLRKKALFNLKNDESYSKITKKIKHL